MPRIRLTGLFLFMTVIFLGLASAATKTSHIRFKRPDPVVAAEAEAAGIEPSGDIQFRSVPIIYPLTAIGVIGLLLWFVPAALTPEPKTKKRTVRRRKPKGWNLQALTSGLTTSSRSSSRRRTARSSRSASSRRR